MSNLINDILLKTGIITSMSIDTEVPIQWFKGIYFSDIIVTYIIPLVLLLSVAVYLKLRYNKRKQREQISLSNFMYPQNIY
jgi:heme/copper-type cytochrome/quinol oxidase subunit 2